MVPSVQNHRIEEFKFFHKSMIRIYQCGTCRNRGTSSKWPPLHSMAKKKGMIRTISFPLGWSSIQSQGCRNKSPHSWRCPIFERSSRIPSVGLPPFPNMYRATTDGTPRRRNFKAGQPVTSFVNGVKINDVRSSRLYPPWTRENRVSWNESRVVPQWNLFTRPFYEGCE